MDVWAQNDPSWTPMHEIRYDFRMSRADDKTLDDELGGLIDPDTLRIGKPLDARPLAVPSRIWLDGDRLRWGNPVVGFDGVTDPKALPKAEWLVRFGAPWFVSPSPRILDEFLRLERGTNEDVLAYARRWGVLGICEHGVPHTHQPFTPWNVQLCRPLGWDDPPHEPHHRTGWEPISAWRRFSREARVILRTAAKLHESESSPAWAEISDEDVEILWPGTNGAEGTKKGFQSVHWGWVTAATQRWLGLGDVRPYLHVFDNRRATVRLGTVNSTTERDLWRRADGFFFETVCGLFGVIASQVLFAATGPSGAAFCVECEEFFRPRRKPRVNQRVFCDSCRAKSAPAKWASRDRRLRERNRRSTSSS